MVNKKRKEITIKKILDTTMVHGIVFTMLTSSVPAMAENKDHWVGNVGKLVNNVTGQIMQANQQSMAAAQQAQLMQQFQPTPIAAKFFPHCKISQAITAFPEEMCQDRIEDPMGFSTATAMKEVGYKYKAYYDNLLTPAQNQPFPVGVQCLENARKGFETSIADRLNALTDLMAKMNEAKQQFEANNKKLLEDMSQTSGELFGGGKQDVNTRTTDFTKLFSQECQNVIGLEGLTSKKGGLDGVLKSIDPLKRKSANFMATDKSVYEKELQTQIEDIKKQVADIGVEGYISTNQGNGFNSRVSGTTSFKNYSEAIQTNVTDFNTQYSRIQSEVKAVDPSFELPPLDKNFSVDFSEFVKGSEDYFRKDYINKCATMADKGIALSTDQILKGLEQKSTGNRGTTIIRYREALQGILDDEELFFDDKMAKIKALQNSYGKDITITYVNGMGKQVTDPPYTLFQKTVALCEQKYTQDDTFKPGGSKAISQKKKVKRAKTYLNQLKSLEQNFIANLTKDIHDKVINCEGMSQKSNSCNAKSGVFNPGDSSFCIKHAENCSTKIAQCHKRADNLVRDRKQKLKRQSDRYNNNVRALVIQEKVYLEQLRQKVLADAKYLQQYFPGANYVLPEDLFLKVPQLSAGKAGSQDLGVDLLGGGNLDFLDKLPEQIAKLKTALGTQSSKVMNLTKNYIDTQKKSMQDNQKKWTKLAGDCAGKEKEYRQGIAMMNANNKKAYDDALAKAKAFCRRFDRLAQVNPAAGCGEGDNSPEALYEDASAVASFLSSEVDPALNAYSSICGSAQGEQTPGTEDDDETPQSEVSKACSEGDWESVKVDMTKKAIKLGASEDISKAKIEKYLSGSSSDVAKIDKELKGTAIGKQLTEIHKAMNPDIDNSSMNDKIKNLFSSNNQFSKDKVKELFKTHFGDKAENCNFEELPKDDNLAATERKRHCTDLRNKVNGIVEADSQKKFTSDVAEKFVDNYDQYKLRSSGDPVVSKALAFNNAVKGLAEKQTDSEKKIQSDLEKKVKGLADAKPGDVCAYHRLSSAYQAAKDCKGKDKPSDSCFNDEFKTNIAGHDSDLSSINRSIASLDAENFNSEWSSIGEQSTQECLAESSTGQRGGSDIFGDMSNLFGTGATPGSGAFGNQGVIR